jgi:hypothetical protein
VAARHTDSQNFRILWALKGVSPFSLTPPSNPPPEDWVISYDKDEQPCSTYGDSFWNFAAQGHKGYQFDIEGIDKGNTKLLKRLVFNLLYLPALSGSHHVTIQHKLTSLRVLARACSTHQVLMSDLHRYTHLFPLIAEKTAPSRRDSLVSLIHRMDEDVVKADVGFSIGGRALAAYLRNHVPDHNAVQSAYIPDRINSYLMGRLSEFIDDFNKHLNGLQGAYQKLVDAYKANEAFCPASRSDGYRSRTINPFDKTSKAEKPFYFEGGFEAMASEYGIDQLLNKWLGLVEEDGYRASQTRLGSLFTLANQVGLIYLLHYSLQRKEEAAALPPDAWQVETDAKVGEICYLAGETTKTIQDSDARWIVPRQAKRGFDLILKLAEMESAWSSPQRLLISSQAPWMGNRSGDVLGPMQPFSKILRHFPLLLDEHELRITQDDYQQALQLTPELSERDWFGVGKPWHFHYHQSRRTGICRLFAWGASIGSMQFLAKHKTSQQSLYYGRNHTRLAFNSTLKDEVIAESYNAVYRNLQDLVRHPENHISPHKKDPAEETLIRVVSETEHKALLKQIKGGGISYRDNLLGGCARQGDCEYGGLESAAKCAGVLDGNICRDLRVSPERLPMLEKRKEKYLKDMEQYDQDSPSYNAAKIEICAIEVYEDVIKSKKCG